MSQGNFIPSFISTGTAGQHQAAENSGGFRYFWAVLGKQPCYLVIWDPTECFSVFLSFRLSGCFSAVKRIFSFFDLSSLFLCVFPVLRVHSGMTSVVTIASFLLKGNNLFHSLWLLISHGINTDSPIDRQRLFSTYKIIIPPLRIYNPVPQNIMKDHRAPSCTRIRISYQISSETWNFTQES